MFNPKYRLTDRILTDLTAIAEIKGFIERAKILPQQELRLRRQAVIRMTHHSTEIEGNQLSLVQVAALYANKKIDAPDRDIHEVKNYLNALRYIEKLVADNSSVTEESILKIHQLVTDNTLPPQSCGHYRTGPIYVVRRRLGWPQEVIYVGPEAGQVPKLVSDLVDWLKDSAERGTNPVLAAGIAHLELAAIHPFNDGNGRTARSLATLVLYHRGYDFRRLFALEDYYNTNREDYYRAVNVGESYDSRREDITAWLEYFVRGVREEIDSVREKVMSLSSHVIDERVESQVYLTPEQLKILDFLDQVGRITVGDMVDILSCPRRTAQMQLQRLKRLKMIKSTGKGRATAYILNK